jgi:hypothetical protein
MYKPNKEHETETVIQVLKKTPNEWTQYFNQEKFIKKSIKQISYPDFYAALKNKDKSVPSMKQDCIDNYMLFSDRVKYKDNLMVDIIHDAGSKLVTPKIQEVKLPIYNWEEIKSDAETEKALQTVFNTQDKISEIISILKEFSDDRKLVIYSASERYRKLNPVQALRCYFDDGGFCLVFGDWVLEGRGYSRGVIAG